MKHHILLLSIAAMICAACTSSHDQNEWVTIKGNKFIDPQGNELIFRGLS